MFVFSRVRQEGIRAAQRLSSMNSFEVQNTTENIFDNLSSTRVLLSENESILSTEQCIYVNAALVGCIFVFGIIR